MFIKRHISYLKYILRHKWFVFVASKKLGCSIWLVIIHDLSKFYPSEWFPYARTFYKIDGTKRYYETNEFNVAWLKHIHRNPHHWQHWVLQCDDGRQELMEIPNKYLFEMMADWAGAGKAITGEWEVYKWFNANEDKIKMHWKSKNLIAATLQELFG